jgi:GNAT superfamily N-acetyltransferase
MAVFRMVIHSLEAAAPPGLQRAIEDFEAVFKYPLGNGRFFRVSYGSDRTAFIRTLGERGACFAAEKDGRVVGIMEGALVRLLLPDGETRLAAYVADVKVLPEERRKMTTARLLQAAFAWGGASAYMLFSVTLDGVPVKPPEYSGRAGIPAFFAAGRMVVVRLGVPYGGVMELGDERYLARSGEGERVFAKMARGRYALPGGTPAARSVAPPVWLVHPGGEACGRFEDRRRVRQLISEDATEMRPAFLSCFGFENKAAGVELIAAALRRAGSLGYRALRLCASPADLPMLKEAAGGGDIQATGGTIFATEQAVKEAGWILNASEI